MRVPVGLVIIVMGGCGRFAFDGSDGPGDPGDDAALEDDARLGEDAFVRSTLPSPRARMSCVEIPTRQRIWCLGGEDATGPIDEIVEYDPITNQSALVGRLPTSRFYMSCVWSAATSHIYCFGGEISTGVVAEILRIDPDTAMPTVLGAALPTPRRTFLGCATHVSTGAIYCVGGEDSAALTQIVEHDPTSETARAMTEQVPGAIRYHACTANGPYIYCAKSSNFLRYDPATGGIDVATSSLQHESRISIADHPETDSIYMFGGGDASFTIDTITRYNVSTGTVTVMATRLPTTLMRHSCVRSSADALIYCFGGEITISGPFVDDIVAYRPPP